MGKGVVTFSSNLAFLRKKQEEELLKEAAQQLLELVAKEKVTHVVEVKHIGAAYQGLHSTFSTEVVTFIVGDHKITVETRC